MSLPIVLSFGMGLDGSVIYGRWTTDPTTRDFDLADDLIVIAAQTGGESKETKRQMEQHLLPMFRANNTRFIQIARAGPSYTDRYVVLSDSKSPTTLYIDGQRTLYDEMIESGTVPQFASGKRMCSDKFKGSPIRWLLRDLFGNNPFRYVFGFAAGEERRSTKALLHEGATGLQGQMEFPLQEWGLDRPACAAWSLVTWGEVITRSCCSFCPFAETSGGQSEILARYRRYPHEAATTMLLEHVALALNPRSTLYPAGRRVIDVVRADNNQDAVARYQEVLDRAEWALYHVQRLYRTRRITMRRLSIQDVGNQATMEQSIEEAGRRLGLPVTRNEDDVTPRIYIRNRENGYPATEEMLVIAPMRAKAKAQTSFIKHWIHATEQLILI